ncbi:hypothetical protein AMS68_003894 [Peltaster fructicola]|uniref:BTB domain-containing protein n=1 Tax=Peltaster fructicola TaxID=286661 RepID=A0A6H0XUD3_9PEZI|nr:hypothetical protein AMS68_003894 [Peltaster fructicola]
MATEDERNAETLKLLKYGTYSDFTIFCQGYIFKVHRAILARHSRWFRVCFDGSFVEAQEGFVDLSDDNVHLIAAMLKYCYTDDFDDEPDDIFWWKEYATPQAPLSIVKGSIKPLEFDIYMWALANKYEVLGLESLVRRYFDCSMRDLHRIEDFNSAIEAAYLYVVLPTDWYKDQLLYAILTKLPKLTGPTSRLYLSTPQFACRFASLMASAMTMNPARMMKCQSPKCRKETEIRRFMSAVWQCEKCRRVNTTTYVMEWWQELDKQITTPAELPPPPTVAVRPELPRTATRWPDQPIVTS